jgi:hypothetical protein
MPQDPAPVMSVEGISATVEQRIEGGTTCPLPPTAGPSVQRHW